MKIQQFFTARELAEIAKEAGDRVRFPETESAVIRLAKRERWSSHPSNLSRKRAGRGGAMEYNFSILPEDMQAEIRRRDRIVHQMAEQAMLAETAKAEVMAMPNLSLKARQAKVRDARNAVLLAISNYQIRNGTKRGKAIAAFLRAVDEWIAFEEVQGKALAELPLTIAEQALVNRVPRLTAETTNDGFGLLPEQLIIANDRAKDTVKIGRSSLYQWYKVREEKGVEALAPDRTKVAEDIPEAFKTFLKFYAMPMKPNIKEALKEYNANHPKSRLNYDQVRRILKDKLNDIERNVGREGLLTLRSRMAYVTRIMDDQFLPTTIYVADGKTLDAEVADWKTMRPMKPEMTSIMDVATRKCVGWAVSRKENTVAVTEALRNACVANGIPAMFYTDRGAGYKNKVMDDDASGLMARLSITKMHALPYNSQAKGNIERFNKTVWNPLAKKFPTYLGKDMDKEAAGRVHKQTRSDIKEFGQSRLLPTWEDFLAAAAKAVEDYNAAPHSALPKFTDPVSGRRRHMSPNEAWEAHVKAGFKAIPVEESLKDDLFRPYVERVANRGLVKWNGNEFFHQELFGFSGEKVMVGYDDTQARFVWVREIDKDTGEPGAFICKADFSGNKERYIPLTAQRAAEERRAKGQLRRLDDKAVAIREELGNPAQLDHRPEVPLEPVAPAAEVVISKADNVVDMVPAASPQRRIFRNDKEFCAFALDHFEELQTRQVKRIKDLLNHREDSNWLAMSGIDVDRLRELVRAAPDKTEVTRRKLP
jgi:putative transposase